MQAGNAEGKSYTSSLDGVRKIVRQEGISGLYRGIAPKLCVTFHNLGRPLNTELTLGSSHI
jgi:hypothetical protein